MTLDELGQRMSCAEFDMWRQYEMEHGLPDVRGEITAAHQAAVTLNPHMKKPIPVQDMMLFTKPKAEAPEEVDAINVFRKANAES